MSYWTLYFIHALLIGLAFPVYFKIAEKYKIVDVPNKRSSHNYITIRGAGILLIISFLFFLWPNGDRLYLSLGCILAALVGYADDRLTLRASLRLSLYTISVLLVFYQLGLFSDFNWYMVLLFFIVALGVINTYNFMDGINGITGLYSTAIVISAMLTNRYIFSLDYLGPVLPLILAYLILFGFYNYRKRARTFLGDAGSISLGLFAVFIVLMLVKKTDDPGFIVFLAVYGVDSVGTIILRLLRKENIFEAHRSHLYQDMTNIVGHSHVKIASLYAITQLIINVVWLANFHYQWIHGGLLLVLIFLPAIAFYLWYKNKHQQLQFRSS